jgi:glycosyl transferase family 1
VSYHEAFEALKNGDFKAAASLLEAAATETGYTSDIINHAYTLALHHAGDKPRLAEVAFWIGNTVAQTDPASAMDYFQRSLLAGLEGERVRKIAEIFGQWAAPRLQRPVAGPVDRVAHVVPCLLPNDATTRYVKLLASGLRQHGVQSTIFTTESAASWFFNPTGTPQSQTVAIDAEINVASVEGDFIERAKRVADLISRSGIPVAFFHGSLSEQITARVAAMRPAPLQVHVNHGTEMGLDVFDGCIHVFQNALTRSRFSSNLAEWIPLASDIETRLQMSSHVTRESLGLESATSVSATYGDLQKVAGGGYVKALTEIMKRFPKHFHLFAGAGNVRSIRSVLHSEGVLPRVRFLGDVGEIAPLLPVVDVYLASFPVSGGHAVIEAMGAARPVVVLRFPSDSQYNSGAELVGLPELIAPGEADYIQIADRLLRDPALRQKQGAAMLARFRSEFRPERQAERYVKFIERLITHPEGMLGD